MIIEVSEKEAEIIRIIIGQEIAYYSRGAQIAARWGDNMRYIELIEKITDLEIIKSKYEKED